MYQLYYSNKALKDLEELERNEADRITKKIYFFAQQKEVRPFCKRLEGFGEPTYRFRIGEYRVSFDISSSGEIQILNILRIKNRKDIYDI